MEFQQETEYYVTGTNVNPVLGAEVPIQIDRGTVEAEIESFVFQAKDNQTLIDGRLFNGRK